MSEPTSDRVPTLPSVIIDCSIPGDPFPAMRPRADFERRRMHTPSKYQGALDVLAWELTAARKAGPVDVPVDVVVRFYRATRHAVDVDNLLKTVLDAAKGILWADDHLVMRVDVSKVIGVGDRAHTRLLARTI